jgi:hypothetical protein
MFSEHLLCARYPAGRPSASMQSHQGRGEKSKSTVEPLDPAIPEVISSRLFNSVN